MLTTKRAFILWHCQRERGAVMCIKQMAVVVGGGGGGDGGGGGGIYVPLWTFICL